VIARLMKMTSLLRRTARRQGPAEGGTQPQVRTPTVKN
jgi:hypothetical protein